MPATANRPSTARPITESLRILPPGGMSMGTGVGSDLYGHGRDGEVAQKSGFSYPSPTGLNLVPGPAGGRAGRTEERPREADLGCTWKQCRSFHSPAMFKHPSTPSYGPERPGGRR